MGRTPIKAHECLLTLRKGYQPHSGHLTEENRMVVYSGTDRYGRDTVDTTIRVRRDAYEAYDSATRRYPGLSKAEHQSRAYELYADHLTRYGTTETMDDTVKHYLRPSAWLTVWRMLHKDNRQSR